jgi:hypothetical protein
LAWCTISGVTQPEGANLDKIDEKTIRDVRWKEVSKNEWSATLGGIRFNIFRVRNGLWTLRRWDPEAQNWVIVAEQENKWSPWKLRDTAKQMAWNILKSKGETNAN